MEGRNVNKQILRLNGIYPPVPTPFDGDGRVAPRKLTGNIDHWNRFALRGYVVLGTNGEFVLLTEQEKLHVLETARMAIPSDKLMIAGTGCESTGETIRLTRKAAEIGADAALIINPSYYKARMTPEALIHHFRTVADASPIPTVIYNMPACTGIDLTAETITQLAEHPNIIGLKDSSGNVIKLGQIHLLVGPSFQVLAGSASFLLPALSIGAAGGILALANIAPTQCLAIYQHFLEGDWNKAREVQVRIIPANTAVTRRWGVPALKTAMDMLGFYGGPVRSPLLPLSDDLKEELQAILLKGGILEAS
jgi:4-hydroxy-2-oxoglutarate aldolase